MSPMLTTATRLQGSALSSVVAGAHRYPSCQIQHIAQERTVLEVATLGNPDTFGKPSSLRW